MHNLPLRISPPPLDCAGSITVIVDGGGGWSDALMLSAALYCVSVVTYTTWGDSSVSVAATRMTTVALPSSKP